MRVLFITIALLLLWVPALQAASIEQQRDWFKQARSALNSDQIKHFHVLKDKLGDYALTPYLDIWYAGKLLRKGDEHLVADTLIAYAAVPESIDLRNDWLKYMAKKGNWAGAHRLIEASPALASKFPEIAMMALWRASQYADISSQQKVIFAQTVMEKFSSRWQQGKPITALINPIYTAWVKQGHPNDMERWSRIISFASKGHWQKTAALSQSLSKQQRQWLKYWRSIQKNPEKALQAWPESLSSVESVRPASAIISDGIKRLSRQDPAKAWSELQGLKSSQKQIAPDFFSTLERSVALRAARRHQQIASKWLAALPSSFHNEDTRGWQVRLAIIVQDWPQTLAVIGDMPIEQRQQDRWMYWKAQAMAASGNLKDADQQFRTLAEGRGYYNFLSAEKLALPFKLASPEIVVADTLVAEIDQIPGIQRASEWLALNSQNKAIREWHFALRGFDTIHWKAATVLASRWGWQDQVIRAAFKAKEMDALTERFPMTYAKQVKQAAHATGLSEAAIWSIIRQESAFNAYARSYVGAKGLMQLMPATARQVARKLKMGKGALKLFSPATNIRLGSSYLAGIKERFGNLALAAAGYNAGPYRVSTWLERVPFDAPEAWVEAIPFNETRRYVQQVMAFMTVYEWRQQKEPSSLVARLHAKVEEVSLNGIQVHDVELR
ncbi:lytic murein transglycosylase [Mariprofundus sp. EBB-1]|uniref:lytic transglycosylase domain-containing protein n=1 Tax=Mariprofundus sp. EBB-1 TaxID=2650971 RepID=UPI000EF22555|nr:lytic transglycosylase domain-containing protein [Mariprofundus sp. EBB-1]RLL50447.1 lytic murein transglycosylase [Mariprofundus sp. EBB-1]